jgi:anti-sigma regulatory factor (Ser/Thr protein kinase)
MSSPEKFGAVDGQTGARATPDALEQTFDGDGLVMLRNAVAAHGSHMGLTDMQVDDLVLVVQELAANAVRHGGGRGSLRLWRTDHDQVLCQVSDPGPAPNDLDQMGLRPLPASSVGGRGLWLVRQFTGRLDIQSGDDGTRITAVFDLSPSAHR